jgi:hypothetical protein
MSDMPTGNWKNFPQTNIILSVSSISFQGIDSSPLLSAGFFLVDSPFGPGMQALTISNVVLSPARNWMRRQSLLKVGFHRLLLTRDARTSIIPGLPEADGRGPDQSRPKPSCREPALQASHSMQPLQGTCRLNSYLKTSIDAPDQRILRSAGPHPDPIRG